MGIYLNSNNNKFLEYFDDDIFVDKSWIIDVINGFLSKTRKYMCVTRPRRFGKTLTLLCSMRIIQKGVIQKKYLIN